MKQWSIRITVPSVGRVHESTSMIHLVNGCMTQKWFPSQPNVVPVAVPMSSAWFYRYFVWKKGDIAYRYRLLITPWCRIYPSVKWSTTWTSPRVTHIGKTFNFLVHVNINAIIPYVHESDCGPLASYVKLRVAHASGMPGTFSPPPRVSDPDMHHGTCVTHVPWCIRDS